jgi:hypothetical protein
MADKKPAGKPAAKPSGGGGSAEGQMIFIAVIAVVILFVALPTVLMFFGYSGKVDFLPNNLSQYLSNAFSSFVDTVSFISIFISLLLVMGIIYTKVRYKEIIDAYTAHQSALENIGKGKPGAKFAPVASGSTAGAVVGGMVLPGTDGAVGTGVGGSMAGSQGQTNSAPLQITNPKWIAIEKLMQSHNVSEWKVAILEADILLYDMLTQMGYEGDSIGEILKSVDKANFVTLDDAWKAHRIRNIIAHEGANYELSREEAERTIRLFKRVFDEFYFV